MRFCYNAGGFKPQSAFPSMSRYENPIFCALDTTDLEWAAALAHELRGHVGGVKLGLEFFYAHGREGFFRVAAAGLPVFLDLKLHDIPNTVAGGLSALSDLKPAIVNVHAGGGLAMMQAAGAALAGSTTQVIAVTILTSLDTSDLVEIGFSDDAANAHALNLARLTRASGLAGVVCSTHDLSAIRSEIGDDFLTVVPGIRPAGAEVQDQKRIATPSWAVKTGADILVIGRPITRADDPVAAADKIAAECRSASSA